MDVLICWFGLSICESIDADDEDEVDLDVNESSLAAAGAFFASSSGNRGLVSHGDTSPSDDFVLSMSGILTSTSSSDTGRVFLDLLASLGDMGARSIGIVFGWSTEPGTVGF